jgi:spore cortex protein
LKKFLLLLLILLVIPFFTGCAASDNDQNGNNFGTNVNDTRNVRNDDLGDNDARNVRNGSPYDAGQSNVRNTEPRDDQSRMVVADRAAERVADLDEVSSANIIVTDNNAYAAVVLENDPKGNLTTDVENRISEAVKATLFHFFTIKPPYQFFCIGESLT